jgi:hypothetical protein
MLWPADNDGQRFAQRAERALGRRKRRPRRHAKCDEVQII